MSLQPIPIEIRRKTATVTATFGTENAEAPIAGSPFTGIVYRVAQTTVKRDEAASGTATDDEMRRISIMDPAAPIKKGDIALVPADDDPSTTERALVLKVRRYSDRTQCDLETGVNG